MARIRVTEDVFLKIRDKLDRFPMLSHELIAQLCGCSDATVDNVAYCRTWDEWEARKKMLNDKRKPPQAEAVEKPEIRPGQTQMQDIPMQATPEKRVKVYFTNGHTAVFPIEKLRIYMEMPKQMEIGNGMVSVNWDAISWLCEYQEDA